MTETQDILTIDKAIFMISTDNLLIGKEGTCKNCGNIIRFVKYGKYLPNGDCWLHVFQRWKHSSKISIEAITRNIKGCSNPMSNKIGV